ncbi:putative TPR_REGION domain-containing protein [Gammaproteobacteria bacterium]
MDNPTLRITQISLDDNRYRCELTLDSKGRFTAVTDDFNYHRDREFRNEVYWYLEEYPQYPDQPATERAAVTRNRLKKEGESLFTTLFLANEDGRLVWDRAKRQLTSLRIEILTVNTAKRNESIVDPPWELLRDPTGGEPLVSLVLSFVRLHTPSIFFPTPKNEEKKAKLRILFVIAYPDQLDESAFRSVARRMIQGLPINALSRFSWEVLYPPSFTALSERLYRAKEEGNPFHVVHYDGEGIVIDPERIFSRGLLGRLKARILSLLLSLLTRMRSNHHGYLLFDPHKRGVISHPTSGAILGELLRETGTPWLVLNACHTDSSEHLNSASLPLPYDPYQKAHAFATITQDIVASGVNGVISLGYTIPTASSAQFVIDIYNALGAGCSLGEAVTRGRRRLYRQPWRGVGLAPLDLPDDWSVPLVYEAAPLHLFPKSRRVAHLLRDLDPLPSEADQILPQRSAWGLFGRDETLTILMRAFNNRHVVLLHGPVGGGKTQAAADLVRWGLRTGWITDQVIIWSDLSHDRSLDRLLGDLRRACEPRMDQFNLSWPQPGEERKTNFPLQLLSHIQVLWIWDHVEVTDTLIPWTDKKEVELFLRAASRTNAHFLLISHQDEWSWLGRLPERVLLPPLPAQECLAIIRAIVKRAGENYTDSAMWRSVLEFANGNPSVLVLVVNSILREKLKNQEEINNFMDYLQSAKDNENSENEDENEEDEKDADESEDDLLLAEGYDYPLSIILVYQFLAANFTSLQQSQLSLLHLFKGFVDVDVLAWMTDSNELESLPVSLRGVTRENWFALLNRAIKANLLIEHKEGYYHINSTRSVLFSHLFLTSAVEFKQVAIKAYLIAMQDIANYYYEEYDLGHHEALDVLPFEEANLFNAWQFARWQGWWDIVISVARGLLTLYRHTKQDQEWILIVERLVRDFVNPKTNGAFSDNPDRENYWGIVTDYRIEIATNAGDWPFAERLQQLRIDWDRQRASGLLDRALALLDNEARARIQALAQSINQLGHLLQKQGKAECVQPYQVAVELNERIDNRRAAAITAIQLARAYRDNPDLQEQANHWHQKALNLAATEDPDFQAKIHQLINF